MKKKIYIAYTGGTIGMTKGKDGYAPAPSGLAGAMARIGELADAQMPDYDIHVYDPLIDSSNMTPDLWLAIASDIADHYDAYDGFVVLHGTDTMAYTASALPFMLPGLAKPVILTGGQIPLGEVRNDSRENLIAAMWIAAHCPIPEVGLFFGNRLLRGNRSVKVNATGFDAFDSPNYPPLATAGIDIVIHWDLVLPRPDPLPPVAARKLSDAPVAVLRLFPGMSADVAANLLAPPVKGVVLETFGVGNAPTNDARLLGALKAAADRGVVLVNCTQCLKGGVRPGSYATGTALQRAGVISGADMTAEAALAKMFFLFSQNLSVDQVKTLMQTSLCGEMSAPLT